MLNIIIQWNFFQWNSMKDFFELILFFIAFVIHGGSLSIIIFIGDIVWENIHQYGVDNSWTGLFMNVKFHSTVLIVFCMESMSDLLKTQTSLWYVGR